MYSRPLTFLVSLLCWSLLGLGCNTPTPTAPEARATSVAQAPTATLAVQTETLADGATSATLLPTPMASATEASQPSPAASATQVNDSASQTLYVVQPGDTISRIAQQHGVAPEAIVQANNLANPNLIQVGQQLMIPQSSAPIPQANPSPAPTTDTLPPTPTVAPLVYVNIPIDGDNGSVEGGVIFTGNTSGDPATLIVRDELAFQVLARIAGTGEDGAGIASVTIAIADGSGEVHRRTEQNPGYCAFGDAGLFTPCTLWRFADNANTWPSGAPVQPGLHFVTIEVQPLDPTLHTTAFWNFAFTVE